MKILLTLHIDRIGSSVLSSYTTVTFQPLSSLAPINKLSSHKCSRTVYPWDNMPWTISPQQLIQLQFQLWKHYFHQFNIYLARIPCIHPASISVKETFSGYITFGH